MILKIYTTIKDCKPRLLAITARFVLKLYYGKNELTVNDNHKREDCVCLKKLSSIQRKKTML